MGTIIERRSVLISAPFSYYFKITKFLLYNNSVASLDYPEYTPSLTEKTAIPVLIIAFQRIENLSEIFDSCLRNNTPRIYVALDVPRVENDLTKGRTQKIENLVMHYSELFPGRIHLLKSSTSQGCGVSVLKSCEWIFSIERSAIILEDDCIPTDDFFNFVSHALPLIQESPDLFIAVGTQFKNLHTSEQSIAILKYPVFWGWATTKERWSMIHSELVRMISEGGLDLRSLDYREKVYWAAGCRRVLEGYVDTWDTLITTILLSKNWKTVSPLESLVRNVGNDDLATHTSNGTVLHNLRLGTFTLKEALVLRNAGGIDAWMRDSLYKISVRHIFSTKFTWILDMLVRSRRIHAPLFERF